MEFLQAKTYGGRLLLRRLLLCAVVIPNLNWNKDAEFLQVKRLAQLRAAPPSSPHLNPTPSSLLPPLLPHRVVNLPSSFSPSRRAVIAVIAPSLPIDDQE